ncbi:VIT and vWA domain-containing protein [Propionivibrio sp.]|uniref:VIT and vWA domain-containing protein n=1 Tax=Propionivibrio sp. TaxID=2212460 RepID=UPI003BF30404
MAIESGESIALRGVEVSARIAGLLAETTLTQKFRNDSKDNLELAYTFPLPVGGALLSFAVQVGERKYHGIVIARKAAEVAYEEAISEGNSAFRLQEIKKGIYSATLGNVMAGEAIEITLTYAEALDWNGRSIRYRLPTTLAPRYGEPAGMQPWQRPTTRMDAEYPLSLVIKVEGPLAKSSIACPSHRVSYKPQADSITITLAAGASMDRDFILEIENETVQSLGVSASARETHVAMLTLLPPAVEPDHSNARDIVIVLDCSGSMMGDSMSLAKEGVQLGLGSLTPKERFAVMGFGTRFEHFDKELQPANRKNIDMARRFVTTLGNLGGTELSHALELALAYSDGHPMDILLLTDGEAWAVDNATRKAKEKGIRIFTVGIGSAVAEDTVRALADQTDGSCELVSPNEDMSARIFRHFNRMRQPEMRRLEIQWPSEPLWESRPEKGCFAGDAYTVVAAFADPFTDPVQIGFESAGRTAVAMSVLVAPAAELSDTIVRIAARQHLGCLQASVQQDWAVRYQLITEQTDYLITVERAADEKAIALPELQVVPQMLPAGWGGTSTVIQCASPYVASCVSRLSSIDYSQCDVPAVVRKSRNVSMESLQASYAPHPYMQFLRKLSTQTNRKLFGSLPNSKKAITRMGLPKELGTLFDELVHEGHGEKEVLLALYQALTEHDGMELLGEAFVEKAKAAIGNHTPQRPLVARFGELLNELWAANGQFPPAAVDRYDIPAFLRKHAD